jgi:uncharacterized protein YciI
MSLFLFKAIPPRATFAQDMTEVERKAMEQHIAYTKGLFDKGIVIVFGPVLDPRGVWGVGIYELESMTKAQTLISNDPAVIAGVLNIEVYEMDPHSMVRK